MNAPFVVSDADGGGLGIIYVLTNADKTWSKIGRTVASSAAGRAASYGKAHGHKWTVFAQFATLRVAEVEANIHNQFWSKRVATDTNAREIFKIKPAQAEMVTRSLILAPGVSPEAQRAAIKQHIAQVRAKLKGQESFLKARAARSVLSMASAELDVYPQYIALDALERGISVDEMMNIYRQMLSVIAQEAEHIGNINAAHYLKLAAEWKAKNLFARLLGSAPRPTDTDNRIAEVDVARFPSAPYYARELIVMEDRRTKAAAYRADTKH